MKVCLNYQFFSRAFILSKLKTNKTTKYQNKIIFVIKIQQCIFTKFVIAVVL